MNAPLDDIRTFLGDISDDEYEQRRRIRVARNAACYKAHQTENQTTRALCWIVTDKASEWVYSSADLESLTGGATFLRRLLTCADQIEQLEVAE